MNVNEINNLLLQGKVQEYSPFYHYSALSLDPYRFQWDFGLDVLPQEPGLILIRGARQYGKSSWLESQVIESVSAFGPGSTLYFNGDLIGTHQELVQNILEFLPRLSPQAHCRRIFIDEVTAIAKWEHGLKYLWDSGATRNVLVVTTGSKASDLRRGEEMLPGRKGKLKRTSYWYTPVSFPEFVRVLGSKMPPEDHLTSYLLTGGSPIACKEIALHGLLSDFVIQLVKEWILGAFTTAGRSRANLLHLMELLFRFGSNPVAQNKIAKEAGLANNTVVMGYLELLSDLLVIGQSLCWDIHKKVTITRKPAKYPFINLLAAVAWSSDKIRSLADFQQMPPERQGVWWEWLVAQELWRRRAKAGIDFPELLPFWQNGEHEIDFVWGKNLFEVKSGNVDPRDFHWFKRIFPKNKLYVIGPKTTWEEDSLAFITMEDFLKNVDNLGFGELRS